MDTLKIVIDHLQDCIDYMDRSRKRHWVFVRGNVVRAAFQLLKAQEPRVMTITEAFDAEVAWLERYADPDDAVEPIIQPVIIRHYENGYWECLIEQDESAALTLFIEDFGTEFRFWTSRPTEEQRKVVKWE